MANKKPKYEKIADFKYRRYAHQYPDGQEGMITDTAPVAYIANETGLDYVKLVVHKNNRGDRWQVAEYASGKRILSYWLTRKEAVDEAVHAMKSAVEKRDVDHIRQVIADYEVINP